MPKVLIAECKQEVSTFNPHRSVYDDFAVRRGDAMLRYHRGVRNEVGGALSVLDETSGVEVVPANSAFAITSGGTLAAADWQRLAREFLEAVRAAGPVDGAYFCLHGAMASEDEFDPEGHLITEARRMLGESTPLVVSLDLHGVLTDRMVAESDAIVAYHTYPHTDFFSTGQRSARLLLRLMRGEARPVTAKVARPAWPRRWATTVIRRRASARRWSICRRAQSGRCAPCMRGRPAGGTTSLSPAARPMRRRCRPG
jgi:microcystin degradation protein MlrC